MSNILTRMKRRRAGLGNKLGVKKKNCACCIAKELRESKKIARTGGHVL